jgi:hypothetical protein
MLECVQAGRLRQFLATNRDVSRALDPQLDPPPANVNHGDDDIAGDPAIP